MISMFVKCDMIMIHEYVISMLTLSQVHCCLWPLTAIVCDSLRSTFSIIKYINYENKAIENIQTNLISFLS